MMSDETYEALQELRKFMFANVYVNSDAKREEGKAYPYTEIAEAEYF